MQIVLFLTLSLCVLAQIMAKKNMRFTPVVKDTVVNDIMTVQTIQTKPKWVKFSVYQVVLGVSADNFDRSYDLNAETMKQAIASCMVGVLPEDVDDLEVDVCDDTKGPCTMAAFAASADDEADKRLYDQLNQAGMLPREDKVIVRYTINVRSELSHQELFDQLVIATVGSTFEDNLQVFAFENAAHDLYEVDIGVSSEYTDSERQLLEVDDAAGPVVQSLLAQLQVAGSSPAIVLCVAGVLFALACAYGVSMMRAKKGDNCVVDSLATIV